MVMLEEQIKANTRYVDGIFANLIATKMIVVQLSSIHVI